MKILRLLIPVLFACSAWAEEDQGWFEINGYAAPGIALDREGGAPYFNFGSELSIRYNLWVNSGRVDFLFPVPGSWNSIQVRASSEFLILHLHELMYRNGGAYDEQLRIMGGIGQSKSLPGGLGRVAASLGLLYLQNFALDPNSPDLRRVSAVMAGAYVGSILELKIWKIENQLRIAYYVAPRVFKDLEELTIDDVLQIGDFSTWHRGLIGDAKIFMHAIDLDLMGKSILVGPEIRAEFADLPSGTEMMFRFGIGARVRM
jgi:hypothetical protein